MQIKLLTIIIIKLKFLLFKGFLIKNVRNDRNRL